MVEIKMRGTFLASANSELAGNATCEMMRSVSLATYGKSGDDDISDMLLEKV